MTPQQIELIILEAIKELQGDDESLMVEDAQIAERTRIDLQAIRDCMALMVENGWLIDGSDSGGHAAALAPRGRRMLSVERQRAPGRKMTLDEIGLLVLQTVRDSQPNSGISVHDSVIAEKTGLHVQDIQDYLDLLEGEEKVELAKTMGGYAAWLTARGRLSLQESPEKGAVSSMRTTPPIDIRRLILRAINDGHGQYVRDSEIAAKTTLDLQAVRVYLDLLSDEDMVKLSTRPLDGSRSARLKARGQLAVENGVIAPHEMKKRTILILAANPKDTKRLRLDEECRRIEEAVERAMRRDDFDVVSKWAVTDDDLRRALLRHEPEIVHFSGHGSESGLEFEREHGIALPIAASALAGLFKLCSRHVRCVVLNACFSQFQAQAIAAHIEFVVGMGAAIGDQAAIKFSQGFYDGIGHGRNFEDAFELGRNAIDLRGIPEHQTPVLLKRTGIRQRASAATRTTQADGLETAYAIAANQAEQSRGRDSWSSDDIEDIRSQVWANVDDRGGSTAVCPIDGIPMKITLHTFEFSDADISAYCVRHGHTNIQKETDPMRPSFEGKQWAQHHVEGMAELSLRGQMVNCPVCGTVVRSTKDAGLVSLNCLRCGLRTEVPVK
jgi:predicted transcriptional regulator